ncbi:MAG: extracellular solute-binding protein [Fimbriimonas sp.]|nr:extracellular solute-binding protein [Fimbriimonas sp.]
MIYHSISKVAGRLGLVLAALFCASIAFAKEPVVLQFTVWDGDISLKVIQGVLDRFERENPDIKVKLEPIPDYNVYHQKMLTLYAANVPPDVAMMDPGHFQALAAKNALLPLNPFFDKTPGFDLKDYYRPIVDAHSYKGQLYVLPRDIAPIGLVYYNKRAFREAGIPYPDGTWTWDYKVRPELKEKDFVWVCQQLTKKDSAGKVVRWAFSSDYPELLARTFTYSSGGGYANDSEHPTQVTNAQPKTVRAYQYASDFMNLYHYMPNSTETSGVLMATAQQLFSSGKIAMYQNGIWVVPQMRKDLVPGKEGFFDWDVTLFPAFSDGTRAAPTGGSGYCIFRGTPHPDEAWRLTRYMAGPVAMEAMARAGIAQPAIKRIALTPGIWAHGPTTPKEQEYPANIVVTDTAVPFVRFEPSAYYWPSVSDRLSAGLDLVWSGQKQAEPVLKEAQKNGQARLDALLKDEELSPFNWTFGVLAGLAVIGLILGWTYWPERGIKYSIRERTENIAAYKFLLPWIIGIAVFTLGPMILSLLMSFADWDIITPAKWRGLENYTEAGAVDPLFWKSMMVTLIYTAFSVPLGVMVALLLALLLNQKVRGIPLFRAVYYVPSLASLVASSLIWRKIFNPENGLLNAVIYGSHGSWLGTKLSEIAGTPDKRLDWLGSEKFALPGLIIMSMWFAGGGMIIMIAGLQNIPQHYYEAATLDGAGVWGKFRAITIPLLTPTLFFSLVTGFIGSFQVFTQAVVMTSGGPNDSTRFYMYKLYQNAFEQLRMGYASAGAWILFAIIMVVTLVQFRASKWVYYEADTK